MDRNGTWLVYNGSARSIEMTQEEKYKQVQKEIAVLLKVNGFKKIRSQFHRELPGATVLIAIGKARGSSTPEELCWQAGGAIFLHALDPIFRAEREPQTLGTIDGDVYLFLSRSSGHFWEITEATDVTSMVSEFENILLPVLTDLEKRATLTALVNRFDYKDANALSNQHINGLVKTAVAAKLCGMTREYELLLEAIAKNSKGDSSFAKYHLSLVATK